MRNAAKMLIGAGDGCSLRYVHEPRNPQISDKQGLLKLSHKQIIKALKVWGVSRGRSIGFLQKRGL